MKTFEQRSWPYIHARALALLALINNCKSVSLTHSNKLRMEREGHTFADRNAA